MSLGSLFYLIGEPGAGKSTLMAELTKGLTWRQQDRPFAHTVWQGAGGEAAELGPRRAQFPGTDGLSMSAQPKVLEWLDLIPFRDVFGEGDRLATDSFFEGAKARGYEVTVAHLWVPEELAAERRKARAEKIGAKLQNEAWVTGRRTKVKRLADTWATFHLDSTQPVAQVVSDLSEQTSFFKVFREGV